MRREGLLHKGTNIAFEGQMFRVDMGALTGSGIMVYGQSEVMKDLNDDAAARVRRGECCAARCR
jgi:p-hydroxybenzoate 3-monooxygenase